MCVGMEEFGADAGHSQNQLCSDPISGMYLIVDVTKDHIERSGLF